MGTGPEVAEQLGFLEDAGVQRVMLQWLEADDIGGLEAMAQSVLPDAGSDGYRRWEIIGA